MTHAPGSFARTLAGIAHLRAAGIPVTIACSLLRQNATRWREIRRFVEQELGLELSLSFRLYQSQANAERLDRSALGLPEIRAYLEDLYRERAPRLPEPATPEELDQLICLAAVNNCRVLPNGDVMACAQLGRPLGNVRETDFLTVWRRSPVAERLRAMRRRDLVKCAACGTSRSASSVPAISRTSGTRSSRRPLSAPSPRSTERNGRARSPRPGRGRKRASQLIRSAMTFET